MPSPLKNLFSKSIRTCKAVKMYKNGSIWCNVFNRMRILHGKNGILKTERSKNATEQDFVNETWTPIMTAIFMAEVVELMEGGTIVGHLRGQGNAAWKDRGIHWGGLFRRKDKGSTIVSGNCSRRCLLRRWIGWGFVSVCEEWKGHGLDVPTGAIRDANAHRDFVLFWSLVATR